MGCLDVLSSVAGCFTLPLFKAGQLVQQWVASSSLWAGAGWWVVRVIGRENSVHDKKMDDVVLLYVFHIEFSAFKKGWLKMV